MLSLDSKSTYAGRKVILSNPANSRYGMVGTIVDTGWNGERSYMYQPESTRKHKVELKNGEKVWVGYSALRLISDTEYDDRDRYGRLAGNLRHVDITDESDPTKIEKPKVVVPKAERPKLWLVGRTCNGTLVVKDHNLLTLTDARELALKLSKDTNSPYVICGIRAEVVFHEPTIEQVK